MPPRRQRRAGAVLSFIDFHRYLVHQSFQAALLVKPRMNETVLQFLQSLGSNAAGDVDSVQRETRFGARLPASAP